ncbi:hypothetical protein JCM3765_006951 [Sporobolomyces pararoseus]
MLPWNPPSSFSLAGNNNQDQPPRYGGANYSTNDQQQQQQQQQQSPSFQQQQQQLQQQQQPQQQPQPYPPMTLASTLHFLQSEHRRYAKDRNEWEIERAEMRARIALLEGEKRGNEGALKSLGRRCKMLEMALRGERSKFLNSTNNTNNLASNSSPSVSGTASPIPGGTGTLSVGPGTPNLGLGPGTSTTGAIEKIKLPSEKDKDLLSAINPVKLASLQKEGGGGGGGGGKIESAAMAPSTSSPGVPASQPSLNVQPPSLNATGTWGLTMGGTLSGRDPRGKARSRDYLKQCLQEITYLTSSTTLNPLSNTSYAAPQIPRPRKVLSDHVPPPTTQPTTTTSSTTNSIESQPQSSQATSSSNSNTKIPGVINLSSSGILSKPTPPSTSTSSENPSSSSSSTSSSSSSSEMMNNSLPESIPLATSNGSTNPSILSSTSTPSAFVPLQRTTPSSTVSSSSNIPNVTSSSLSSEESIQQLSTPSPSPSESTTTQSTETAKTTESTTSTSTERSQEIVDDDDKKDEPRSQLVKLSDKIEEEVVVESPRTEEVPPTMPSTIASVENGNGIGKAEEKEKEQELNGIKNRVEEEQEEAEREMVEKKKKDESKQSKDEELSTGTGTSFISRETSTFTTDTDNDDNNNDNNNRVGVERGVGMMSSGGAEGGQGGVDGNGAGERELVTAVFKPRDSDKEEWIEKLREAGKRAYNKSEGTVVVGGDRELESLEWDLEEGGSEKNKSRKEEVEDDERRFWKCSKILRNHLEAVRVVETFEGVNGEMEIVSGGDDLVVKLWRGVFKKNQSSKSEIEPTITYRGHSTPITSLTVSTLHSLVFSSSLDGTILLFKLPPPDHTTYSPADPSLVVGKIEPKSNSIWGLKLFGKNQEFLALIAADGTIQVWNWREKELIKKWEWEWNTEEERDESVGKVGKKKLPKRPNPTALEVTEFDGQVYLVVAFQNAVVKLYNAETGEFYRRLKADQTNDGTKSTQINAIAIHPALPHLVATAHEDSFVKIFDLSSSTTSETLLPFISTKVHLDGVTSLAFSPKSTLEDWINPKRDGNHVLTTVSHDTSVRFWNLRRSPSTSQKDNILELYCVQEITSHRLNSQEGILDLGVSKDGSQVVTAGADGTIRVWQQY